MKKTFLILIIGFIAYTANAQWQHTNVTQNIFYMAANADVVFAGTYSGHILRSTDNGTTWTDVFQNPTNNNVTSIALNGTTVFAGFYGGGLFRSTDNGDNWTAVNPVSSPDLYVNAVIVNGSTVYAGLRGIIRGLYRSTDNGDSWTELNTGLSNNNIISLVANGNTIFAGANQSVIKSTDGGTTWEKVPITVGSLPTFYIMFAYAGIIYASSPTNTSPVYVTPDNGSSWSIPNNTIVSVYSFAASENCIFQASDNGNTGVLRSTDKGVNWTAINEGLTIQPGITPSLAVSGTTLYYGSSDGIYKRPLSELIPPTITTTGLSDATVGQAYTQTLTAKSLSTVTWSLVSGSLPAGLTLAGNGVISGTPTTEGVYNFTLKALNSGGEQTAAFQLSVFTKPAIMNPCGMLPFAATSKTYSQTLTATGSAPILWSTGGGILPDGITLSSDGILSGSPSPAGTYIFTVKASNKGGTDSTAITITVLEPPTITTGTLPQAVKGTAYNHTLTSGGTPSLTWSIASGSLPPGLSLSPRGAITGNPTTEGTYTFELNVHNAASSDTKQFSITVSIPTSVNVVEHTAINLYPNPAKESFFLNAGNKALVKLFNLAGKQVLAQTANGKTEVNVSSLTPGVYTVRIEADNKVIGNAKIIKQ